MRVNNLSKVALDSAAAGTEPVSPTPVPLRHRHGLIALWLDVDSELVWIASIDGQRRRANH